MNIIADLHTHTIASGHALSSIQEMIDQAKKIGYKAVAITDHGPAMPDSAHRWYFAKLADMPDFVNDVLVLKGIEANVMDQQGTLDIADKHLARLDWVITSLHQNLLAPMNSEQATALWLCVAENPMVDMIGHSEQRQYAYDYDRVTKAFAQNHKVVEMNASSATVRPGNEENLRNLALACKRNGTHIAVDSDAHSCFEMGNVKNVLSMLADIDFPEEQVVNSSLDRLLDELDSHGRPLGQRARSAIEMTKTGATDE